MILDGFNISPVAPSRKRVNEYGSEKVEVFCAQCGKKRLVSRRHAGQSRKRPCMSCALTVRKQNQHKADARAWKGGKVLHSGYVLVHIASGHRFWSMARKYYRGKGWNSGYIFEHRLVMAEHLNRSLAEEEIVHHRNGIKTDNRIENLVLSTQDKHKMGFGEAFQEGYESGYSQGYKDALAQRR